MTSSFLYRRAIPAAARITRWTASDGWALRRFDWPAEGAARGSILFCGGRGDIFEKYLELFAHWHSHGWGITWLDWRGQGGSGRLTPDPHVGHISDFAIYIADFTEFYAEWAAEATGPRVMMGHSMGGHLLLRAAVERVADPDALVLVAPMLGLRNALGAALGERLARMIGGLGNSARAAWKANEKPGGLETRQALLTHDAERYADEIWWQDAHPEIVTGPPSWKWVIEGFASTRALRQSPALKTMRIPTLMLVPMADQLVDAKAAIGVAAKLPDCRVLRFGKEAAHEVLREADSVRNRAIGEVDIFLASRAQRD